MRIKADACVSDLTNKAHATFARELAKKLDLMIVVHPHAEFDASHAIVPMVTSVVSRMTSEKVVILQGFCRDEDTGEITTRRLPIELPGSHGQIWKSEAGELDTAKLRLFSGMKIGLAGGYVGHCHATAYRDILFEVRRQKLRKVTVLIPFDAAYLYHAWAQYDEYRFAGAGFGGFLYEATGKLSYTLRDVVERVYEPKGLVVPHHFHLSRDPIGQPRAATFETVVENVRSRILRGYIEEPGSLNLPSSSRITRDALEIILND